MYRLVVHRDPDLPFSSILIGKQGYKIPFYLQEHGVIDWQFARVVSEG